MVRKVVNLWQRAWENKRVRSGIEWVKFFAAIIIIGFTLLYAFLAYFSLVLFHASKGKLPLGALSAALSIPSAIYLRQTLKTERKKAARKSTKEPNQ